MCLATLAKIVGAVERTFFLLFTEICSAAYLNRNTVAES